MQFYADKFVVVMTTLTGLRQTLMGYPASAKGTVEILGDSNFRDGLAHMADIFCELEMPLSEKFTREMIRDREEARQLQISDVINRVNILYATITGELEGKLFIGVKPADARMYRNAPAEIFDLLVVSQFPSCAYELDEAAKCLALHRSTASVFHFMRALEIALKAVHHCFGISTPLIGPDRNWGKILERINTGIEAKGKRWSERDLFQELYILLVAVKDSWRNSSMHVERKYTHDEARVIMDSTRSLLRKIATRMDENGLPLA